MPTAIYDSSLLTQRKRDKLIAQSIQNANRNATPIIIPQTGYASYLQGEAKNGAITDYRKGCPPDVACNCLQLNQPVITTAPSSYILNVEITDLTVNIAIYGAGTIDWGDGTSEAFDLQEELIGWYYLTHTYSSTGNYIITISGNIIYLGTEQGGFYFNINGVGPPTNSPNPYPNTTSITINNPVGLLQLYANNPGLLQINGLGLCTDLTELGLANNSCSYTDALTLPNLTTLILDNKPQITGNFDASIFPPSITELSFGYNTGLTNLSGLSTSLLRLGLSDCSSFTSTFNLNQTPSLQQGNFNNTPILSLGTLPTTLSQLDISSTSISDEFDISGLLSLILLQCYNTQISSLGTLPTTLQYLTIYSTSIIDTFNISSLTQLFYFNCSNTAINSIIMSTSENIGNFNVSNCRLNLTNIDAIGNRLILCPNGGECNVSGQTPATGAVITNSPWSTLVANGWNVTV